MRRFAVRGPMAKKLVKNRDQFIVRLPEGMRERIKLKADRAGMSMNEAIVWCLEQYFPAPRTLDQRLADIADLVAVMKASGPNSEQIENLYSELRETLDGVAKNEIEAPLEFAQMVWERLHDLDIGNAEEAAARSDNPFVIERPSRYHSSGDGDLDDER